MTHKGRGLGSTLSLAATLLAAAPACESATTQRETAAPAMTLEVAPRREGFQAIVVFLPNTRETRELWQSFQQELSDDFDVIPCTIDASSSVASMIECIDREQPDSVVLVNNPTVRLYQRYQRSLPPETPALPTIVLMSSFLEEFEDQLPNATGIAYEVPLVTSIVNLRTFLDRSIRRVGVLSRPAFSSYISRQQKLAALEDATIVEIPISVHPDDEEIEDAIEVLCKKVQVDALWVLNDNVLLQPNRILRGWMPALERCDIPVIVGVRALVNPEVHFGSFALLPDHEALGIQAADLIFELADENWRVEGRQVDLPLSVTTTVDIKQAREHLGFREDMLHNIDVVVE